MADTCEARVSGRLFTMLSEINFVQIVGWHPPNSKAYRAPNVILPHWVEGRRTGRDHVDGIWVISPCLFLTELKCKTSELEDDIKKLRHIRDTLGLAQITTLLQRQGITLTQEVTQLVLVLGVEKADRLPPSDFILLQVTAIAISPVFGDKISVEAREAISHLRNYLAKNKT